ncbi:unnamed protein product [Linum trigynum]|uniref:Uncharacterized protein n=1 Tax=Linum trigynum TaxID=586398 RepID=A0AAV2GQZ2_9ROSI
MAPRLREQEGDLSPRFVMDLGAKFELGQQAKGFVGNNGMIEILPPAEPCADVTTTAMSLRSIVDDNCKMVVENRQVMVEIRRLMEESLNGLVRSSQQTSLKLASFSSMLDRRLDELLEATTGNTNCLDKLKKYFIEPVVREISLPKNGIDPPPSIATEYTSILLSGGRTTQPRSGNLPPPEMSQPPLQQGGYDKNITNSFTTHVKQPPPVHTVILKTVSEARPFLNMRVGGGSLAMDVLPQVCLPSLPLMLKRSGGCKPPGGQEEVHGSLPPDKLKMKSQVGGQVDVKKGEQNGVSNKTPYLFPKDGMGGISPSPCSGQGAMSSDMKDGLSGKSKWVLPTHTTYDFHNFDNVSKSAQGGKAPCSMPPMKGRQGGISSTINNRKIHMPKKPQQTQATHACSKNGSVVEFGKGGTSKTMNKAMGGMSPTSGKGGMSPTVKKRVENKSRSVHHTQPTQKISKYEMVIRDGRGSKSMPKAPHCMPNMNGKQEGTNKTSRHTITKHGHTKNQNSLCATCRSQHGVRVEQGHVGHKDGHRFLESNHSSSQLYGMNKHGCGEPKNIKTRGLFHEPNELRIPRVSRETRQAYKVQHQPNMSSKVAKAEDRETTYKDTKARQVDRAQSMVELGNSKPTDKEPSLSKKSKHVVYGWVVWFNPLTW